MKRILTNIILMITVALASNAQVTHRVVKLADFTRLAVVDDINVEYRCNPDSAGLVVFDATQEVADALMFTVSNKGRLSIQVNDFFESRGNLPSLTLYSSTLDEAENAGDSVLRISQLPPLKSFKVRLLDNGKVIVRGVRASQLELQILSGKGKIIADGSCDDLSLRLVGTGEIQAYKGKPNKVTVRKLGTIKAIPME